MQVLKTLRARGLDSLEYCFCHADHLCCINHPTEIIKIKCPFNGLCEKLMKSPISNGELPTSPKSLYTIKRINVEDKELVKIQTELFLTPRGDPLRSELRYIGGTT